MTRPDHEIDAYLEGQLTDEQARAIDSWIADDPANAAAFLHLVRTHQMLGTVGQENKLAREASQVKPDAIDHVTLASLAAMEAAAEPVPFDALDQPFAFEPTANRQAGNDVSLLQALDDLRWAAGKVAVRLIRSPFGITGAIAAILALAFFLFNPLGNNTPEELANTTPTKPAESVEPILRDRPGTYGITPVATLTATHNATWAQHPAEAALAAGSPLHPGTRLTLTAGVAEITTNRGAIAILEAPATIELLDNNNALRLHSGKLVGICETDSSKGFLVRTPHMDVTDLGTRFGVDATNLDATQVHVFDGRVSVHAKGEPHDAATARILSTGMAISQKGDFSKPVLFNASHTAFASNLVPNELGNTAIIDRFGRVDTSAADQIAMDGGLGWAGPWQPQRQRMNLATRIGVDRPLASGTGRYLDARFTRTGKDSIASLVRRYDRFEGFDRSKPHRISFLIRTGDSFTPSSPIDRRIAIFDSSRAMNSTSGSDTWTILAYGYPDIQPSNDSLNTLNVDACSWSFYDGQADAQNKDLADLAKIKDTGVKIIPGQTYSIHVTVWPEEAAWDLVIVGNNERYDSREALGRPLRFRSSAKEAGGYLHFHMRDQETGYENHLHIDEVRIEPITNRTRSTED